MKLKALLIIPTLALSVCAVAQNKPALKQATSVTSPKVEVKKTAKLHSDYAEMEEKIIKSVKGDVIPASVPKYIQGQSIEEYRRMLRIWAKNNPTLLSDEYLKKEQARKNK